MFHRAAAKASHQLASFGDPLADPRARTIDQKANGTLALAGGDGAVGDPASESVLGFAALHLC